ncbi:MAG: translation elongation factor Ts [Candidatus Eisenbacteria bacterium]|nr:translation elongation factor Ts [Candidatus Eisenbacteria bacterium]
MTITAEQVKQLRERTGAGMMECKKALVDAEGDVEKAIDALRRSGIARAGMRAERAVKEGLVDAYIHPGNRVGVLIEVNCETDFVARTAEFAELVRNLAMQVAAAGADYVRREEVPVESLEREREIYAAQLREQGKPEAMIGKIVIGKLEKYHAEVCLLEQPYIRDDQKTVGDLVGEAAAKTGENIVVRRFVRFRLGQE